MYNKRHDRNINVLLNILLGMPVLFLFIWEILSGKLFRLSLPLKRYLLYIIAAFIPAQMFYKFLMPLHETGHYWAAVMLKNKSHKDVDIWWIKNILPVQTGKRMVIEKQD